MILTTSFRDSSVDLGGGNDTLVLSNGGNTINVWNVETLIGGTGNDLVVTPTDVNGVIDLGAGVDFLQLAGSNGNTVTIANIEIGARRGVLRHHHADRRGDRRLHRPGAGNDSLKLSSAGNTVTIAGVETLIAGTASDVVTLADSVTGGSIDLGAGADRFKLAAGGNTITIANVETIVGGSGADVVTTASALAGTIDLGAGSDKLTLGDALNTVTVVNVETIVGGSTNDLVTLGSAWTSGTIDLGAGNDRLVLGNFTNTVTVTNVETLVGGASSDTITLGGQITAAPSTSARAATR